MSNKLNLNWDDYNKLEVGETGTEFPRLTVGPKIAKIVNVVNDEDRQLLIIDFDIFGELKKDVNGNVINGEYDQTFKGHFKAIADANGGKWVESGRFYRSYKDTALSFFKAFITAVELSNENYNFVKTQGDFTTLIDKWIVVNLGEEEYEKDGEIKVSLKVREVRSTKAYRENKIKVLELKKLPENQREKIEFTNSVISSNTNLDDLPF